MSKPSIVWSPAEISLEPMPLLILEGNPVARVCDLAHSRDGGAWTMAWDCTAGRFEWYYNFDETVYFIEGSATISAEGLPPRRFGPGEVIYFPAGSTAIWDVETYVRKVAFCRNVPPAPLMFVQKVYQRLRKLIAVVPLWSACYAYVPGHADRWLV